MLSVILLAVLAGGAGLLAVSIAEGRSLLARPDAGPPSLGTPDSESTAPDSSPSPPAPPAPPARVDQPDPVAPAVPPPRSVPPPPVPYRPARVARAGRVPSAFTALEGTWSELRAPWWRRGLSLALIVVIIGVVALAVAGVVGAAAGVVAELLGSAIG